MKIITIGIAKGGTAKTASAAALSQAAVHDGKKVLAVDLDPQANLTYSLGAVSSWPGAFELLQGADAADSIQSTEQGIDVIAASPNLSAIKTGTGSANRLKEVLEPLRGAYDLIIIDTAPLLGELNYNALRAADGLIIPLEPDNSSLQGFYAVINILPQVRTGLPPLELLGTILTRYDSRPTVNRYMKSEIERAGLAAGAPLLGEIRPAIAVREAMATKQSLFKYAPRANPSKDYWELYNRICRM